MNWIVVIWMFGVPSAFHSQHGPLTRRLRLEESRSGAATVDRTTNYKVVQGREGRLWWMMVPWSCLNLRMRQGIPGDCGFFFSLCWCKQGGYHHNALCVIFIRLNSSSVPLPAVPQACCYWWYTETCLLLLLVHMLVAQSSSCALVMELLQELKKNRTREKAAASV